MEGMNLMSKETVLNPHLPPVDGAGEGTVLNPHLRPGGQGREGTVLNPQLRPVFRKEQAASEKTVLNPALPLEMVLQPGTRIGDRYEVIRRLDQTAGEADLFLCHDLRQPEDARETFVFKLYHRQQALKKEVYLALRDITTPTVTKIHDLGSWRGRTFEVSQYYPGGSLEGVKLPYAVIREKIIPQLAEALHTLHERKILHKDLKPSNIMRRNAENDIALIDFGISSMQQEGSTVVMTRTGLTPHYAAPETFRNLFLEESDYYAMGVTLCALFQGQSPYHGMTQERIMQLVALQKLPIPDDMPDELKDLITGLTYPDITNRRDANNPNRRWTHDEVMRWLRGEKQTVPGGRQVTFVEDMVFCGRKYSNLTELTEALVREWDEGKKALATGVLAAAFRRSLPVIAPLCAKAQAAARAAGGREDIAYFHLLYELLEDAKRFIWRGSSFEGTTSLGSVMLSDLQSTPMQRLDFYAEMLKQKALSAYVTLNRLQDTPQAQAIAALEDAWVEARDDSARKQLVYFQTAYLLSGQRKLALGETAFYTLQELSAHMQRLADQEFSLLQEFCHELMTVDFALMPQFEAWLIANGCKDQLEVWLQGFRAT